VRLKVVATQHNAVTLPFATPCTLDTYLTHYADLSGPLKKAHLSGLLPFVARPAEREKLESTLADNVRLSTAL
jgi:hypothetical protein